jgi:hypothetical protein
MVFMRGGEEPLAGVVYVNKLMLLVTCDVLEWHAGACTGSSKAGSKKGGNAHEAADEQEQEEESQVCWVMLPSCHQAHICSTAWCKCLAFS